ncbi:dendritic cell-specific transmembrane protein [Bufo gargarizans]|uniref:dendritic cell-specific transmembrane protein n=1 Tax=Bufo gargarizans TaxID=30331 RepID=UPI001CF3CADB|nr:dendritic cell-specific transmembrane protein [Bufo gargarizans]
MMTVTGILDMLFYCKKLFVSGREDGRKNGLVFAFLCWLFGMMISGCLIVVFALSKVGLGQANTIIALLLGMIISVLAFIFKSVRCTGLLFLLCCGMREGRKVLIAIGTSIVVFNNVKNILGNLKVLADSIVCNLEAKRVLLKVMPFHYYIRALYSIYQHAKRQFFNPLKGVVELMDNFQCNAKISEDELKTVLNETKQRIQDLSSNISTQLDVITFVGRIAFLLIGISIILIGAVIFLKNFLATDNAKYENAYITKRFMEYDESRRQRNMLCVLPLNKTEQDLYITIPSLKTSQKQKQKIVRFFIPMMTHIFTWTLISVLDFMLYWLILTISKNLQGLHPVEVPITLTYTHTQVDFIQIRSTENIYSNQLNISLFEPQCTPKPGLSLSATWIPLSILISVLFFLGLISAFLVQIKLLVTAAFYPDKDLERVAYLHNKILQERTLLSSPSESRELKKMISQVDFWFPIVTRKHFIKNW